MSSTDFRSLSVTRLYQDAGHPNPLDEATRGHVLHALLDKDLTSTDPESSPRWTSILIRAKDSGKFPKWRSRTAYEGKLRDFILTLDATNYNLTHLAADLDSTGASDAAIMIRNALGLK